MAIRLSHRALADLEDIRTYTIETWGQEQWLKYYRGLVDAFEQIEQYPDSGRDRSLFAEGMRSVSYSRHIIFYKSINAADNAPVILRLVHGRRNLPALVYYDDLDASG